MDFVNRDETAENEDDGNSTDSQHSLVIGLQNPYNFCYGNSLVQQLNRCDLFREDVLHYMNHRLSEENNQEVFISKAMQELSTVFTHLSNPEEETASIERLYKSMIVSMKLKKEALKEMRDVSEFFSELIKLLLTYSKKGIHFQPTTDPKEMDHETTPFLQDHFAGKLLNIIQPQTLPDEFIPSLHKPLEIIRPETFYYISLSIPNPQKNTKATLVQSIQQYVDWKTFQFKWKLEPLVPGEDVLCTSTSAPPTIQLPTRQSSKFHSLSNYLIFYLRRFNYNCQTKEKEKIHFPLSCSMQLDMSPFFYHEHENKEGKQEEQDTEISLKQETTDEKKVEDVHHYRLIGMILHLGDLASEGHYVSLVKDRDQKLPDEAKNDSLIGTKWILCDDEKVEKVTIQYDDQIYEQQEENQILFLSIEEIEENVIMLFFEKEPSP
jgi:uncharacterized UBP type Zn finger protein